MQTKITVTDYGRGNIAVTGHARAATDAKWKLIYDRSGFSDPDQAYLSTASHLRHWVKLNGGEG
jgi:hypothetical protein